MQSAVFKTKLFFLGFFFVFISAYLPQSGFALPCSTASKPWSSWRAGAEGSGHNPTETRLRPPLTLKWRSLAGDPKAADVNLIIEASPLVADGRVYIATLFEELGGSVFAPASKLGPSADSSIVCLDLKTGAPLWSTQLGDQGIWATPTLSPDRTKLYAAAWDGYLYALDSARGTVLWRTAVAPAGARALRASPIAINNRVFVATYEWDLLTKGKLLALDALTGQIVSVLPLPGGAYASPTAAGSSTLILALSAGNGTSRLQAYNIADGTLKPPFWQVSLAEDSLSTPLFSNNIIIHRSGGFGSASSQLHLLNPLTGQALVPAVPLPGSTWSSPAADGKYLFISTGLTRLAAFDIRALLSGSAAAPKWEFNAPDLGYIAASPAVANGVVYIATDDTGAPEGVFYALDALTGKELWRYEAQGGVGSAQASPAVSNGTVVFVSYDDDQRIDHGVFAFRSPENGCPQVPWTTNQYGTLRTNLPWNYTMGYHFTPKVDGMVTALGALFSGTAPVYLWDQDTGELLAQVTVSSANNWSFSAIAPVKVRAGKNYTVAVSLKGQRGSYRYLSSYLPKTFGDISIIASTYQSGTARPVNRVTSVMYGQADILFVPEW